MYPSQTVHFLTTKLKRTIPLPGNVSYLTVHDFGSVPLPYPENYFSHIRASTLPTLVPSASLPELFNECYKLLAPGGLLEIRIMDAAPLRKTAGPVDEDMDRRSVICQLGEALSMLKAMLTGPRLVD